MTRLKLFVTLCSRRQRDLDEEDLLSDRQGLIKLDFSAGWDDLGVSLQCFNFTLVLLARVFILLLGLCVTNLFGVSTSSTMMLPCFQPCRYESNLPWRGHSHRWVEKSNHRETFDTIKKGSLRLAKIIQTEACHKILRVDLVFFCISCIPW